MRLKQFLVPLIVLGLLVAPADAPAQKPRAERPTYAVGDRWILADGVYDLVRIERDVYVFAAAPGREIHLGRDLGIARIVRDGRNVVEFDPPIAIPWPLVVGQRSFGHADLRLGGQGVAHPFSAGITSRDSQSQTVVEAYGDVEVAAGTVKAFRIAADFSLGADFQVGTVQLWYAPDVRQIVKVESAGRLTFPGLEVVSFPGAPRAPLVADVPPASPAPAASPPVAKAPAPSTVTPPPVPPVAPPAPAPPAPPAATAPPAPATSPFRAVLSSPDDLARVEHDTIALAGLIAGGKGVGEAIVSVNGAEVWRAPAAAPTVAVSLPVRLREGQNTIVLTASEIGGATHQDVRTVHYRKVVPFVLAVTYPADQARLTEASTVVVASAASGRGLAHVRVLVNGVEVHRDTGAAAQRSAALTVPITLRDGTNVVVVSAAEPDGTTRQEVRTVVLDRSRISALPPAPAAPPPPDRWAVVIGIGHYASPAIPSLKYTVPDAEAIYQTLVGPAGFKKEHVLLLTDRTERKPTLRNIKWALGTFLARSAKREDTVAIFFAGHGAPEVDSRGLERDGLAKYLVPSDADPDDLYSTALPMDELQTIFGRLESERVVAFVDACYSGAAGGRTFTSQRTRAGRVDDYFLERLTRSKGRVVITASRASEVSLELADLGHGLFTYYLVRGLGGAADLNRDGIVTLQELYEYLEQEVTRKSRAVGANQHPVMKGEMEGVLPLVKLGPARTK